MLTNQFQRKTKKLVEFRLLHGWAVDETRGWRREVDVLQVVVGGSHWVVGIGDWGRPVGMFIVNRFAVNKRLWHPAALMSVKVCTHPHGLAGTILHPWFSQLHRCPLTLTDEILGQTYPHCTVGSYAQCLQHDVNVSYVLPRNRIAAIDSVGHGCIGRTCGRWRRCGGWCCTELRIKTME